ncbi:hypothetical protein [Novosphingobium sp.]|uniref:hypothetical protein n=1 Tax=Novosphingobium sp. TaxID=1874826 RepID=UPI0025CE52B9|nr:hypothetical protein [Novosphingobium sp.]
MVTDLGETGARIQLCDLPVVARVAANGTIPGAAVRVRLKAPIRPAAPWPSNTPHESVARRLPLG